MGTSNFHNKNASRVYAAFMNEEEKYSECSECGEKNFEHDEDGYVKDGVTTCPVCNAEESITHDTEDRVLDTWQYEEGIEYMKERLAESKFYSDGGKDDNDRNFHGRSMGYLGKEKLYGDVRIEVRIQLMLRSGYYEGANLDYNDAEIRIDGYDAGDISDVSEGFDYASSNLNAGLRKILAAKAAKWAEASLEEIVQEAERLFTELTTPLVVTARFSNGETWYQKA